MLTNMKRPLCEKQPPANSPLRIVLGDPEQFALGVHADDVVAAGAVLVQIQAAVGADGDVVGRFEHAARSVDSTISVTVSARVVGPDLALADVAAVGADEIDQAVAVPRAFAARELCGALGAPS
jgi:hypothetical protein